MYTAGSGKGLTLVLGQIPYFRGNMLLKTLTKLEYGQ